MVIYIYFITYQKKKRYKTEKCHLPDKLLSLLQVLFERDLCPRFVREIPYPSYRQLPPRIFRILTSDTTSSFARSDDNSRWIRFLRRLTSPSAESLERNTRIRRDYS